MTLRQQAALLRLLKQWRDLCLDVQLMSDPAAHLFALTELFHETDRFLDLGRPDPLATEERGQS